MAIRKRTWTSGGKEKFAWVVDYRDGAGKRRQKTYKTKKAAESWSTDTLFHVQHGLHTADSVSITVADAAEDWIRRAQLDGLERSTIVQYREHVDRHINPHIGGVKLSRLTTPGMEAVRDQLLERLSRPTAKKVLTSIKSILYDAQRRGHVAQNVARGVSIKMDQRHKRHLQVGVDVPSSAEVQKILEAAKGHWRPLLVTAVFTGLRASELRGLTWDDVDLKNKVIHVRQRADLWNQIGSLKSGAAKRTVPMSPMVLNVLKAWRLECPTGELGLVFPNGKGKVQALSNIYNRGLAPLQVRCAIVNDEGKAKYGMHRLRHFYASWLIDQGFQAKRVQTLLGHSDISLTFNRYGHLFPNEEDEFARLAAGELSVVG